jgi:sarcosine oxidase subunit delta
LTPVQGFYLDSGWGTWGFKATPVCGKTMSHTVARDQAHPLIHGFGFDRFARYAAHRREGRGFGRALRLSACMKLMTCPINGPRAISEFACGGELRAPPDPKPPTMRSGPTTCSTATRCPGVKQEWWCHTPSGVWFIAERDTATDTIRRTYLYPAGNAGA